MTYCHFTPDGFYPSPENHISYVLYNSCVARLNETYVNYLLIGLILPRLAFGLIDCASLHVFVPSCN
jgi:hypothetical protein